MLSEINLLVLAGGEGLRLKAAVSNVPKALAPINGTPFLQLQIENWMAQGLRKFTFLLHHQADQIINFLKVQTRKLPSDCRIDWVTEPSPMDTGGAVALAVKTFNINGDFLLTNGDTWLGWGFRKIVETPVPAIAVVKLSDAGRYGQVLFNTDRQAISFSEKGVQFSPGWINAGISHLNGELFDNWDGQPFSLEHLFFPDLVREHRLHVVPIESDFIDIGVPRDYHRFCRWISNDRKGFL